MVNENEEDLKYLQSILHSSIENAGKYLVREFQMPDHSLSAKDMIILFQNQKTISVATVTAKGEPRVSPTGVHFYKSYFYIPSVKRTAKVQHLKKRPGISFTYHEGIDRAVIVHGIAILLDNQSPMFDELVSTTGEKVDSWADGNEGIFIKIVPDRIYSFNRYPLAPEHT